MRIKNIKKIVVHCGRFHSDDVFTVAFCLLAAETAGVDLQVERRIDVPEDYTLENGILVADMGNGPYDHHEPDDLKEYRIDSDIPYASFGKVARDFHTGFISNEVYEILDSTFIAPMDLTDNFGGPNTLSNTISKFNKLWDSDEEDPDEGFFEAVDLAKSILKHQIKSIRSQLKAKKLAEDVKPENGVVYLDMFAPISKYMADRDDVLMVGSPSLRGGYNLIAVKDITYNCKILFPEQFRGKAENGKDYEMIFCHQGGHIASFNDKEHAKIFANLMMKGEFDLRVNV